MVKVRLLIERSGGKRLAVLLASILVVTAALSRVAPAQAKENDKAKIAREVAKRYIQAGIEQYERGRYIQAEKSFLGAMSYEEYLTAATREKLEESLEKAHEGALERKRILEHVQTADRLIKQGYLTEAKSYLEKVKDSEFLREEERKQIAEGLRKLDSQLREQPKEQVSEIYNRSVELYRAGRLKEAHEGFVKVAKSASFSAPAGKGAQDYLAKIDKLLRRTSKPSPPPKAKPAAIGAIEDGLLGVGTRADAWGKVVQERRKPAAAGGFGRVPESGSFMETVLRQRRQRRDYIETLISDVNDNVQKYINMSEFDRAKEEVEGAERRVNEFRLDLGDNLFKQYSVRLRQLADDIARKKAEAGDRVARQKKKKAIEAQKDFRRKTETARRKRINDLMNNAKVFQRQQRYEEALGHLEMLLALDPVNDDALLLKDTLELMVSFREQLEIRRKSDREKAAILLEAEKATIPWADELTYGEEWRQISAKRKPDEAIGQDPRDIAVYKQLDEIVDLSGWSPEMSFRDALEELKNAVQPPLKIVVFWGDLVENAEIDQTTAINMDPISAAPLGTALELLLRSVSAGLYEVGYVVEKGVITIATSEALPSNLVTRVYDVTILLGRPAEFYDMGGGGGGGGYGGGGYGGGGYGGYGGGGYGGGGYGGGGYGGGGYGGGGYGGGGYGGGGYGGGGYGGGGYGGRGGYGGGGYGGGGYGGGGYGGGGYGGGGYGGGGYGGRGGYGGGGYGGGGYGGGGYGGRGGYGGGGYGGGGYGGGGYGGGGYGGGGYGGGGGYDYNREYREFSLVQLIQETIEPDSWYDIGTGEGTITSYEGKKLIIMQTPEIHTKIERLLAEMRKSLGHQVSIEARFLVVSENFLEDIGLDVTFTVLGSTDRADMVFNQGHADAATASPTGVPGSLAGTVSGLEVAGGWGNALDDLQVHFILKAVQAHRDSRTLTAPKLTVLSGETAAFSVQTNTAIALPPEVWTETYFEGGSAGYMPRLEVIQSGTSLNVTPIISPDKKHVLLNITTYLNDFLALKEYTVEAPMPEAEGGVAKYTQSLPETEFSQVQTRVSVPDGGTLLLGGQKVTAEVEMEAGVPILSHIPIINRLFSNRSKVKDNKILLILVKPTVILQEERDIEAIAGMEGGF